MAKKKKAEKPIIERGFEPIKRKDGGYSYRTQVTTNGVAIKKTFLNIKDARTWKAHMLSVKAENKANGIKWQTGMYFEDLCDRYLSSRTGTTDSTKLTYASKIRSQLIRPFGKQSIGDIGRPDVMELQRKMEEKKHSYGGINTIVCLLSSILDFAVDMEYLEKNPIRRTKKLKVDANKFVYWTKDQVKLFLHSTMNNHFHSLFRFALYTGLRRGEICGLLWKNVFFLGDDEIRVTFGEQLTPEMLRQTVKGHEVRSIPLSSGAKAVIMSLWYEGIDQDEYIFKTKKGFPVPPNTLTTQFRKAQLGLAIPKMKFHGCRHTFASLLASLGISIKMIAKLLGHKDPKVTQRYAHLSTEDEQKTVKKVDFEL